MLGIEIKRDRKERTLSLGQGAYTATIINCFNLTDANPLTTPMEPGLILSKMHCPSTPKQANKMQGIPYQRVIGSLMYAALGTRPDIVFAVTALLQFMQNPG